MKTATRTTKTARAAAQTVTFETDPTVAIEMAFSRIDRVTGRNNFVKLVDLRKAVKLDRPTFDAALRTLRIDGTFGLDGVDGRHVRYTDEDRAAWITEAGRQLAYVVRK